MLNTKTGTLILLTLLTIPAQAQTLQDYLKQRKNFGISQASSPDALTTFVGQKVLEVSGYVSGYIESDGKGLLILDNPDGRELYVNSTNTPDWLKLGSVNVRMIIRASRATESAPLESNLIAACIESSVAQYDEQQLKLQKAKIEAARKAAEAKAARTTRTSSSSSRGGRPNSMPGNIPTIDGPIGRTTPGLSANVLQVLPQYTQFILNTNKKLSYTQAEGIAATILKFSVHYGVDARLVVALVLTESSFNPNATSHAGAQGLGQLMPGTAKGLGVSNSYDTEQNLYGTVKLLRGNLDKYIAQTGDDFEGLVLALAAYNAGGGAVRKHGGVPPYRETQNYVRKVIATYKKLIGQ